MSIASSEIISKPVSIEDLKREQELTSSESKSLFEKFNSWAEQQKLEIVKNITKMKDLDQSIAVIKNECRSLIHKKRKFTEELTKIDAEAGAITKACNSVLDKMLKGEEPEAGSIANINKRTDELNSKGLLIEQMIQKLDMQLITQIRKEEQFQSIRNVTAKINETIKSIIGKESARVTIKQAQLAEKIQSLQTAINSLSQS